MQFKKSLLGTFVAALCVCGVVIFRAPERPDADVPASDAVSESVPRARRAVAPKDSDSLAALPPETPEPTGASADPAELRRERRESPGVAEPLAWHAAGTLPRKGETFRAEFFDDVAFDFRVEKAERLVAAGKEMTVLRGRTCADGLLNAVCVVSEGRALVTVDDFEQARVYALAYDFARGAYFSAERDVTKEAVCGTCAELHADDAELLSQSAAAPAFAADESAALSTSLPAAAGTIAEDDKLVLDYLAIYDTTGAAYAEGNGGLAMHAAGGVAIMNNCFENSNIAAEYHLVGVDRIDYTTVGGGFGEDLSFIRSDPTVAALREAYGADIVQLYALPKSNAGVAGLAYLGPWKNLMFSAVLANYVGLTSAHECGHNLGCGHSRDQTSNASSHAYAVGFNGTYYHTVMSYGLNGTRRVPIFSGPNSVYGGETLGSATENNVRKINESTPEASEYFQAPSSIFLDPEVSLGAEEGDSVSLTFFVSASWIAKSESSWISLSRSSGAEGLISLTLSATEANTSYNRERVGYVVVECSGIKHYCKITQQMRTATYIDYSEKLDVVGWMVASASAYSGVNSAFEADGEVKWAMIDGEDRFSLDESQFESGNLRVVSLKENTTGKILFSRVALRAAGTEKHYRCVQLPLGSKPGPDSFSLGTFSFCGLSAQGGYSWHGLNGTESIASFSSPPSWISVTPSSNSLSLRASANSGATREAQIELTSDQGSVAVLQLLQLGGNGIDFDAKTRVFEKEGGSFPLTIRADWDVGTATWPSKAGWTVSTDADWLTLSETSGTGDKTLALTAAANSAGNRTATVTATINGTEYSLEVTQWGTATYLTVSDSVPGVVALNAWSSSVVNYADAVSTDGAVEYFFEGASADCFVLDETAFAQGTLKISTTTANASGKFLLSTLVLKAGSLEQRIRVVQAPCGIDDGTDAFRLNTVSRFYEADFTASWSYSTSGTEALEAVESNVPWLSARVNEDKTLFYAFASKNTGAMREGTVTVISDAGSQCTFTIYQLGRNGIDFDAKTRVFEKEGGALPLTIRADWDSAAEVWPANWTVSTDADWLTLSETSGSGDKTLTLTAAPNPSGNRTATVTATIGGMEYSLEVTQWGTATYLNVSDSVPDVVVLNAWSSSFVDYADVISTDGAVEYFFEGASADSFVLNETLLAQGRLNISVNAPNASGEFLFTTLVLRAGSFERRIRVVQAPCGIDDGTDAFRLNAVSRFYEADFTRSWIYYTSGTEALEAVESNVSWLSASVNEDKTQFYVFASKNTGAMREGTVTVISDAGSQCTFTIYQLGGNGIDFDAKTRVFEKEGGEFPLTIRADWDGAAEVWPANWTVSTDADWLTLSETSGTGDKTLTLTAAPNPSGNRTATATATIGGTDYVVTVSQIGITPTLQLSSDSWNVPVEGGEQGVSLTSNTSWTATSSTDWLYVSPESGYENSILMLSADSNEGAARTATVTVVAGTLRKTITVTQSGFEPTLQLSSDSWSVPVEGGVQSVSLTSNTSWTATSSADWLYVSPESGYENSILMLRADSNEATVRTATVTVVAGTLRKTITVTQSGFEPTLQLSSDSWNVPVEGGEQGVSLTSNTSWAATSSADWLSVSPESGYENSILMLRADSNVDAARTATVTVVAGTLRKTITVTQGGFGPTLELSLDSWSVPVEGGVQNVSLTSNTSWTATSSAEWLRVSPESGQEDGVLTLTAEANRGAARTATVTVVAGTLTKRITVTQKVLVASLSLGAVNNFPWEGGVESLTIYSTIPWTIESAASWLTPQTRSGYGSTVISLVAEKNSANAGRKALVIVKAGSLTRTLTVRQAEAPEMILPGKTVCIVDKNVGTYRIAFTANVPVKAVSKNAWISVKIENGEVVLTLEANPLYAVRKGTVELTNAAGTRLNQIFVEQDAGEAKFSVNDEKPLSLPRTGITMSFPVEANMAWRVEAGEDCETWLSVANGSTTGVAPAGVGTLTLSCKKNPKIEARTGTVVFTCADAAGKFTETRTYVVTQNAGAPEVSLAVAAFSPSFRAETLKTTLTANMDWRLSTPLPEWLRISPESGSAGDAIELTIEVAKHESSEAERSATAEFVCGDSKATLTITQGAFETIRAEFDSLTFSSRATSRQMRIYPNGAWKISELPGDWMKSNAMEGLPDSGIVQLKLTVSANASAAPRSGMLVLECGETRVKIPVTQQRAYDNPTEIEKAGVPEFSTFAYADESDYVRLVATGEECECVLDFATALPGIVFSLNPEWLDCELSENPPTLWVQAIPNFGNARETWVFVLTADGELYAVPVRQEANF